MGFLLFLGIFVLVFVLGVVSFGLNLLRGIFSLFFPFLRRSRQSFNQYTYDGKGGSTAASSRKNKIFEKSEGEYADYEEVK